MIDSIVESDPGMVLSPKDEPLLVSVDVEATGPTPANGELLSIGAVALTGSTNEGSWKVPSLDTSWVFEVNLMQVNGRTEPTTMKWWEDFPGAYATHRQNTVRPVEAMIAFEHWIESFGRKPIFIAWPAAFDFAFINSYFWQYRGDNPFGYSPVCMKNYALGMTRNIQGILGHREEFPEGFVIKPEAVGLMSHVALHDAWVQALMLINMLKNSELV